MGWCIQPFDEAQQADQCAAQWGVRPRPYWATQEYGGRRLRGASNIVWSNGDLDPWSGGGVLESISDSLVAVVIKGGAHHLDLMWSHPLDPASVRAPRLRDSSGRPPAGALADIDRHNRP